MANGEKQEFTITQGTKGTFNRKSLDFEVTGTSDVTIGVVGGNDAGEYVEGGHWWYKADGFQLKFYGYNLYGAATELPEGGAMDANTWYYFDVETAGGYIMTATTLGDIVYTIDGTILTEALQKEMDGIHITFKFNAETGRPNTYLNGELVENDIRTLEVSNHVSPIATLPFVREAMVAQQQAMGQDGGIVMDGRDIGTVVFPHAELKIFVTASAEVRAQRRFKELQDKGMVADYDDILRNVQERDYIDSHREVSPLRQADDALLLDNSDMTIEEQNQWLLRQVEKVTQGGQGAAGQKTTGERIRPWFFVAIRSQHTQQPQL